MNFRMGIFVCLIFFVFSCASRPVQTEGLLDWDSGKFEEKDGNLFNAVKSGNPSSVQTALADNPNINVSDRLGQTAFMWACHNGSLDIIKIFLDHDDASRAAKKTKKYKPLDVKAQSKPKDPELKYNALFCYVMSNGINPYNQEARDTLKRIIEKDPSVLDMTDYYGETVIHKLIRSNNNYFDVVITNNDKKTEREKQELLNKPSKRHSPLRLAIEVGNRRMVEVLVEAAEKGMAINDFSNDDIPVIVFDYGNGDLEIFLSYFKGKMWDDKARGSPPRPNSKFMEAYNQVSDTSGAHSQKVTWFFDLYDTYESGKVANDPNLLALDEYTAAKNDIFNLARKPMSDAEKKEFFEKLLVFPDAVHLCDDDDIENKTFIQYIVELQSGDVLERVLQLVTPSKMLPAGNGYGDYLAIALLSKKKEQMHFLLDRYPDFQNGINNLMNPKTSIEKWRSEEFFGLSLTEPLQIFCASPLSDDKDLLAKMARFYRPRFYDQSYRRNLIYQLVSMGKHDIFEFFLDYDESFYGINYVWINNNQPVLEVLFINQERLARKIVNYFIRKKLRLDLANETALRSGDSELWRNYQSVFAPPNTSSRSESNLPENKAQ